MWILNKNNIVQKAINRCGCCLQLCYPLPTTGCPRWFARKSEYPLVFGLLAARCCCCNAACHSASAQCCIEHCIVCIVCIIIMWLKPSPGEVESDCVCVLSTPTWLKPLLGEVRHHHPLLPTVLFYVWF